MIKEIKPQSVATRLIHRQFVTYLKLQDVPILASAERRILAGLARFGADLLSLQIDRNVSRSQWHVVLAQQSSAKLISSLGQRVSRLQAEMYRHKEYAWIQCHICAGQNFFAFFPDDAFFSDAVHIKMTERSLNLLVPRDQSGFFVKFLFCCNCSSLENNGGLEHA